MIIEWFGHSCFLLKSNSGTAVLIDPFDPTVGYEQPHVACDCLLMTHKHFDHSAENTVIGETCKIDSPGQYEIGGVQISGFESFHDNESGMLRGKNTIYKIIIDGVAVCHLGDLGHIPSPQLYEKLGKVDVLMIPVGGNVTIDAAQALEIINALSPNIILPMHYLTDKVTNISVAPVSNFIELANVHYDVSRTGRNTISVEKNELKKRTRIYILEYN